MVVVRVMIVTYDIHGVRLVVSSVLWYYYYPVFVPKAELKRVRFIVRRGRLNTVESSNQPISTVWIRVSVRFYKYKMIFTFIQRQVPMRMFEYIDRQDPCKFSLIGGDGVTRSSHVRNVSLRCIIRYSVIVT